MSKSGGSALNAFGSMATLGTSDLAQGHGLFSGAMDGIKDFTGANASADAEGAAAMAQLGQQQADRATAMQLMAPTEQELQELQQNMAINQQSINQGQSLINSANPALIAAAQQAVSLMNGGSAASLAPIQNQRSQQRAQLQSQLEQQLGPGYATSSAGLQALNNFDQGTANVMTQAQQSTIGQYLGASQNAYQIGAGQQQQGIGNAASLLDQRYGFQRGQAGAISGTPVNPGLAYSGQIANAQANQFGGLGGVIPLVSAGANAYSAFQGGKASAATANNQNAQANYYNGQS